MIILNIGLHLAVHLVLNLLLHTTLATAGKRTADFNAIDRSHYQPAGPIGVQDAVAFQATSNFTTECEHRFGRLSF